jgi:hypothetical protein
MNRARVAHEVGHAAVGSRLGVRLKIALIFASLSTTVVHAEIYNYSCKVDGRAYPLRVDDNKNVLEWRGKKYSLTENPCGRYGWHAEGNGTSFDFCTATKGYAWIEDKDEKNKVECDLKR